MSQIRRLAVISSNRKPAEHHGRIVKTTGDGTPVEFASRYPPEISTHNCPIAHARPSEIVMLRENCDLR
jgi:hypothetical protein